MAKERSNRVDSLVREAFEKASPEVTVMAVGGYGREELFPCSDVDLLLLVDSELSSPQRDRLSEFLRILWDASLRVSQSVHTPRQCCEIHEGNLELTISLLDRRYLCGPESRAAQLETLFPKFLNSERDGLILHLARMTRGRYAKYGNTIYHLEPNVKEHPGGLRDLHVIHWLRCLKPFETGPLDEARAFLFDLRARLHLHYGRDNNLLTFEAQEVLAADPALWMREYYRHARDIYRALARALDAVEPAHSGLLQQFLDRTTRLSTSDFTVLRGRIYLRSPGMVDTDPRLVSRLMIFQARHQLPLAADTERRLQAVEAIWCDWEDLQRVLSLPKCVNTLRAMTDLGLFQRIVPEWSGIDCLVVRDFYHRYTVDEHTLMALQTLEPIPDGQFARLLSEIDHPALLRLALLLHDIGKGSGAGGHAGRSSRIADQITTRLGVPEEDRQTVLFLVEHHLYLSSIMTSRDLSEPATARQIAHQVGTIERLKLLTIMTYADISAVNPNAMTPWRLEQLWQTYLAGQNEFTRELETERIRVGNEAVPEAREFLDGLPVRYLKTHTPAEIAGHLELARHGSAVHLARTNGSYRATIVAPDRPFLLSSLSGALASFGMNIVKAEAFGNSRGQALDTFVFDDPHRTLELNPDESQNLQDLLLRAALGKINVEKLIQKRRAPLTRRRIEPTVAISNTISETSTLIQIVAEDRPGLLYDLTRTISLGGGDIDVVLIDTEAHRALDVFYVRAAGAKLSDEQSETLKARLLAACLEVA